MTKPKPDPEADTPFPDDYDVLKPRKLDILLSGRHLTLLSAYSQVARKPRPEFLGEVLAHNLKPVSLHYTTLAASQGEE